MFQAVILITSLSLSLCVIWKNLDWPGENKL